MEERVTAYAGQDSLTVMTIHNGAAWMWNRMHQLHLFKGGGGYFIWGVMIDLVSITLILFGVSGVYLWYTLKANNRRLGWILFVSSSVYTVGSIVYLMV